MAPSLVQSKSGTTSGAVGVALTITLTSNTTAGNCLIVTVTTNGATTDGHVGSITLGGAAGNFNGDVNAAGSITTEIWSDWNCAGGQTSVVITSAGGSGTQGLTAWVTEWSGLMNTSSPFDKSATNTSGATSTSWTSNTTATLSQSSEVAIGVAVMPNTVTGPGAPWTNLAQLTDAFSAHSITGWNVVSATTALAYAGTVTPTAVSTAAIATYKAGSSVALTTPNIALAAPVPAVSAGATVALTTPNIALGAPAPTPPFFPVNRPVAELFLGAWTDISRQVYQRDQIHIQRGRPNEASTMQPSTATLTLNNRDGRFTTRNPSGIYYPSLVQNTPLRISQPVSAAGLSYYLRFEGDLTSYASAPDSVGLQITGPIDVRVDLWPSDYQGGASLASKWAGTGNAALDGWLLGLRSDGTLAWWWSTGSGGPNNLNSSVPLPYFGQRIAVRVLFTPSTGTAQFFTAPTMAGPFTQLGNTQVFGATSLNGATGTAVHAGWVNTWNGCLGAMYEVQVLSGVSLKADPVFSSQNPGTTSFTDAQANTWTLNGTAEISGRQYRFHGEMGSFPKAADPSAADVYSQAGAFGVSKRLQNSNTPGFSAMRRAYARLPSNLNLGAYWPCEDGSNATSLGSALGGPPMTIASGPPTLASSSGFACSAPLPVMNGAYFYGQVPQGYTVLDASVRFLWAVPAAGETNNATILQVFYTGGTASYATLIYTTAAGGGLTMNTFSPSGALLNTTGAAFGVNGQNLRVAVDLKKNGGNVDMVIATLAPGASFAQVQTLTAAYAGTVGSVTGVEIGGGTVALTTSAFGHVSVQGVADTLFDLDAYHAPDGAWTGALSAWAHEPAAVRFARLCSEEGIACRIVGPPNLSMPMGNQAADTVYNLLQACEKTDLGMMFEPRQCLGLGYRTRTSLYHQAPLATASYTAGQVYQGFASTADIQLAINDVTAQAPSGSTARQFLATGAMSVQSPPAGISRVETQIQPSPQYDAALNQLASWYLNVRSVDDDRYPAVPFEMARTETPLTVALLDTGDYLQVTNTPSWLPPGPVRQLVAGTQETMFPAALWQIDVNCFPEAPYETAQLSTMHLDTAGSQLTSGITSGAASFQVSTTAGPVWTQAGGDFPFDIICDGERMTVTNITSASSPQTFTVTRAVNGVVKAHLAAAPVSLYAKPILAL